MKYLPMLMFLLVLIAPGCGKNKLADNPLIAEFNTPFGVPPFHLIEDDHFLPAFSEAMRLHNLEIESITGNRETPTFENTIVAYDKAGELLSRVNTVFGGLRSAETNDRLQAIAREVTPMLSAHYNEIRMNQDLFDRIREVYEQRNESNLDPEQVRVVEVYYRDFERGGAALPEDKRTELKKLNERMSMVSLQLGENQLAETNAFQLILENEEDLAGLTPDVISAAADAARRAGMEDKWLVTLHNPSWIPFLQFSQRRDLREKIYRGYFMRGDNDNETTTYFHEFGHALHNFFAEGLYRRTSRSVPRDFVELPSQILENWAGEPELLKKYAVHYETGEPIPDGLINKLRNAGHFNQGFMNTEYLAAAFLDMDWHTADHGDLIDVIEFENNSMQRIGLPGEIIPRYRTTYFGHIFGTSYAAGYYVYRWAGVLDADAFMAFRDSGDLFNPELAEAFRKYILAGNSLWEGMEAYVNFRGHEPSIEPFLIQKGLN